MFNSWYVYKTFLKLALISMKKCRKSGQSDELMKTER